MCYTIRTGRYVNMSGLTKNYKAYNEYLKVMPEPLMPSQLPKRKINLLAISKYAKENHICVARLSAEEKEQLIQKIGRF